MNATLFDLTSNIITSTHAMNDMNKIFKMSDVRFYAPNTVFKGKYYDSDNELEFKSALWYHDVTLKPFRYLHFLNKRLLFTLFPSTQKFSFLFFEHLFYRNIKIENWVQKAFFIQANIFEVTTHD